MAPVSKVSKKFKSDSTSDSMNGRTTTSDDSFSSDSNQGSGSECGKQFGRVNRVVLDKNSDEYRKRRERNNMAVKKSRTKSKIRTQQTLERVNQLKAENEMLETKIKILTKELNFLKDLFLAHAGTAHGSHEIDLSFLSNGNGSNDHKVPSGDDDDAANHNNNSDHDDND